MSVVINKINYWAAPYVWRKKPATGIHTLWEVIQKPFFNDQPQLTDEIAANYIIQDNRKWDHKEYIKALTGNFTIDPKSGFLIDDDGIIIQESIIFDHYGAYPEKFSVTTIKKTTTLPEAILYDHYWSMNYFHFYSDIFTKLHLLEQRAPELLNLPIVVSQRISETRAFKFFLQFPEARKFNWYIQQRNETIKTSKAYLLQPMPYDANHWLWIKQMTREYLKPFDPNRKIFVNRPPQTGRHITNFHEIKPILEEEGFEIVEMENKSIEEQIALFSSAAVVTSIHGAAMANILYCDKRCKVLEVTADHCVNSHYYWLSKTLGLAAYDCLTGTKLETKRFFYPKGRFFLNPEKTRAYLKNISER